MSCTFPSYVAEENGLQPAIKAVKRYAALASAG
jgi:hypothetical protein